MSSEVLLSNIIPFAGSGLLRYAGFCFEKDFEMDANYCRCPGWDVLCWCSTLSLIKFF